MPAVLPSERTRAPRLAWILWAVGICAYITAVLHRTSFGVAGIEAAERFGTNASMLSTFTVLQVLVYAACQIPVGLLLDRFGPRVMITAGGLLMAAGQLLLAFAPDVGTAIGARVLVGAGDAATFISVLSLASGWFPVRQVPLITQLTGLLGQGGQVISALPLVALLHGPGWSAAYGSAAALGVLVAVLCLAVLRDPPRTAAAPTLGQTRANLADAWRNPGTRLGLWTHFATQFAANTFALMWGYPYLVSAQGLSPTAAGTLLIIFVLANIASGPVIGRWLSTHPAHHLRVTAGVIWAIILTWTAVLALPDRAPLWLLTALVIVTAVGGPASMAAFDHARTHNPPARLGTATGIVNAGGFTAALIAILAMGVILDLAGGSGGTFTPEAFRLAWLAQYPLWFLGLWQMHRAHRTVRRFAQVPGPR
ncbi:MFS transporter [Actinocorallia populi]|uniref:MFS transporter n=1 Tax=Actinocorallia populi TaxID=2079200 RepID=UPI000D08BA63|nr:MFS transporter [Actinocorallia populi]